MAVYGRSREKWDPTKSKSKVSKNRTYELGSSLASGKLMFYLDAESIETNSSLPAFEQTRIIGTVDINGEELLYRQSTGGLELEIAKVRDAHFLPPVINFPKSGTNRAYIQSDGVSTHGFSLSDVAKTGRNYDVYLSYWVKLSQLNFGTSKGHSLGGFYRGIPQSAAQATAIGTLNPALILGISSSGAPEIRFHKDTVDGTFMRFSGPSGTEDHKIIANDWTQVTILIRGYTGAPTSSMVSMWIDGNPIQVTQSLVGTSSTNANWNGWFTSDTDPLGSLIGNHTKGYAADNTGTASEGFFGSFGQLLMFSQPVGTDSVRNQMAKFIYEAQREGAYHLHSGIHSSSPRLEQLDLDKDSLYPPNFTLENYTMGAYQTPVERVSKRSESRYTEGYNANDSGYAWKENASQYYQNKSSEILPHLRLHRSDSLLTNGNWYSDDRSEFFAEDLVAAPNGFVVDDQTSDELYREHYTEDTAQKFVEIDVPDDYKDCFVIDIPIPNTSDLTLGTDRPSVNENARINGTAVVSNPQAKIANMAYYNFATKQWETVLATDYNLSASSPKDTNFIDKNDIGFSPMSGLVVPNHEAHAQRVLPKYGLPTSDYGFPFDDKFNASSGQSIDLSKYIDQPVILEGWEIQTKVVPAVGYTGYTGTNQNATFYSTIGSGGKSPFHYGGHGESAVFFNHRRNMSGFDQNVIQNGSNYFHVGTTIPTTYESGGAESQPPIEQPGLVTSGITAFLLKRSKITNTDALKQAYQATAADKTINKHSNCLSNAEGVAWSVANGTGTTGTKYHQMNEHMPDGVGVSAHPEWVNPSTDWSNYESTSLIGWLQQVYHNDEHLESYSTRNNWVRNTDTGNAYRITEGKQIVDMLGKEKTTYVQNLLYTNTDEVDLNVRGNTKSVGKIIDGIPVTNFFIKSHTGTSLGVHESSSDDSARFAVSTSSETSVNVGDGSLADHSIVPRYGAGESTKSTIMPRLNMPTKVVSSSDTFNTFHKEVKMFESIVDDSTVILSPNDELVLGIQNSISTVFASQQIKGGSTNFVRWGRTSLKIPQQTASQTASFVRLYVKKTRSDKDFNIVADSSNYNSNVSRDLGDHAVADQFRTNNVTMYSGSISDDIVGPTYFTPPDIRQEFEHEFGDTQILPVSDYANSFAGIWASYTMLANSYANTYGGTYLDTYAFNYAKLFFDADNASQIATNSGRDPWSLIANDFSIDWRFLSERAFGRVNSNQNDNLPFVELQFPLDSTKSPNSVMRNSILNVYQSIIMQPANLFLKRHGTGSGNPHLTWYPQIPKGDYNNYTTALGGASPSQTESQWYGDVTGAPHANSSVYHKDIKRWGSGQISILEELDDRDTPRTFEAVSYTDGSGNTRTFNMGAHVVNSPSNAPSGWSQKLNFPVIQKNLQALEPNFVTVQVEFRFVRIGRYATATAASTGTLDKSFFNNSTVSTTQNQGYGDPIFDKYPEYPDGTEMSLGDCFYIDANGSAIRLMTEAESLVFTGDKSNQQWARKWQSTKANRGGQVIYIVGGRHDVQVNKTFTHYPAAPIFSADESISKVYTWDELYLKIADCLRASKVNDSALPFDKILTENGGRKLKLIYPDDPVIRTVLENYKTSIDSANAISLIGKQVAPTRDTYFDNDGFIYIKANPLENNSPSLWFTNPSGLTNDTNTLADTWHKTDTTGNTTTSTLLTSGAKTYGTTTTYFLKGYLRSRNEQGLVWDGGDNRWEDGNGSATDPSWGDSYNGYIITYPAGSKADTLRSLGIKWTGLPTNIISIEIEKETFTQNAPHIDRKVAFRTSRGDAGPFGSLNPFKRIVSKNAIWDSIAPKIDVLRSGSIDLTVEGFPQGWLLDGQESKEFEALLSEIKTRVDMNSPNQFANQFTQDGHPIVTTNLYADGSADYQWAPINNSNSGASWPTVFTNGIFPVKNYIELEFSGLKDFSKKTGRDLILGFGNAPSSRHVIRPDRYKYTAFQTYTSIGPTYNTNPSADQATLVVDLTIEPPRGARFGLYNIEQSFPTYIFSNNSYGQLRDMFEQAVDTKTTTFRKDEKIFGSPVVISSINPVNPEASKLMERTQRFNKTVNATITKPYIESNYESKPQETNLNSEKLRVDVAGSIATKAVLAPGNVAANIRRR